MKFEQINGTLCRMVEPKPLLADAKVGWICRHRNGAYSQIGGIDYPCPVTDCISIGKNRYDRDGKHSGEDMRLNPNPDLDIIHAEPLAAEGSAEWAWQMAKLGIETKCSRGKIRISKSGMIEVCYNGMAYAMPMTQSPENRQYVINKMRECSPDGWRELPTPPSKSMAQIVAICKNENNKEES